MNPDAWDAEWPAPAKINLFLHVVGRRSDGYHLLQTVFRLLDRQDTIRFQRRTDANVRLATPFAGVDEDHELSVRAARLLQSATGCRAGVDIAIQKRIPLGGGLGGGSSDAATTLLVLNALWRLHLDPKALAGLAVRLGADVPFFLGGGNAFAEGIGDELTPLDLPDAWYVILMPPVAVPTRQVFTSPELTANSKIVKISRFSRGFGVNDLEPIVRHLYPVVAAHLDWLSQHGPARMSGSGACVFAEFDTEAEAMSVLSRRLPGMEGFVAKGLARHPIQGALQRISQSG
jgi:4-diphosphocytidyl-2-C-methyl-D-erythritol kinase